jgi:hypothetical protein
MRAVIGLALAAVLGCSHETKPTVQPDDHPPLPPASGTPIGYLIDDASELALRDEQLTRLKAIDSDLSDRLAVLDGQQRGDHPRAPDATSSGGRHRGGRRGGMGGAGAAGGGPGGGAGGRGGRGGRGRRAGAGSGSATASANGGAAAGATSERAADVHDALKRAFGLLDPHQREIATRVLSDHGVDVDTDHPGEAAEPGEGDEDATPPSTGSDGK